MPKLVLLRHGESVWNHENRFTGWTDIALSENGLREAAAAARLLREENFIFDQAFTSSLKRAIKTLWIVLEEMDLMWIPSQSSWRLNERHYGALQGLNKAETTQKYGLEKVQSWRRGFAVLPPPLEKEDKHHPIHEPRYAALDPGALPNSESLRDTMARVMPFWHKEIIPRLEAGKRIILVAHGNSLRALMKYLSAISDEEITKYNIPTGIPLVYELDRQNRAVKYSYLGDPGKIEQAVAKLTVSKKNPNLTPPNKDLSD